MSKFYRLMVITNYNSVHRHIITKAWNVDHLNKSIMQECYNILYKASLNGYSNVAMGAIHIIDYDYMRFTLVAQLQGVTFYTSWPDKVASTAIYLNNKYIRSMRGKKEV